MNKEADIKNCFLKVHINCNGCEREVKKLLKGIEGVKCVNIDAEQGKVTVEVEGNVGPNTLIKKLQKNGKHAELWPSKGGNPQLNKQFRAVQIDNGEGPKGGKPQKGGKDRKEQQQQQQLPKKIEDDDKRKEREKRKGREKRAEREERSGARAGDKRTPTMDDCIDVLQAMPKISEASSLYLKALECFKVKDERTIWMRFNTDEGRMAWLKNQLRRAEYLKTHRDVEVFKSNLLPFPREMAALFGGISAKGGDKRTPTMDDCIDILQAMSKISEASPLNLKALECFKVKDERTIWMRFNTDEGRKEMAVLFGGISARGGDKRTPTMDNCIDVLQAMPKLS